MNKHYTYNEDGGFKMVDENENEYLLTITRDEYSEDPRIAWDNLTTMVCFHRKYNLGDKHNFDDAQEFLIDLIKELGLCDKVVNDAIEGNTFGDIKIVPEPEEGEDIFTIETGRDNWYCNRNEIFDEIIEYCPTSYLLKVISEKAAIMPLNLYDHSGLSISTSNGYPYNDRWDAGCVGFVYITKETIMKEVGCEYVLDENGERIKEEYKHENHPSTWGYKTRPLTDDTWRKRAEEIIEGEVETYDQYLRGDVYGYTLEKKVHYRNEKTCPHCGEVIEVEEYDDWEEQDSCYGFFGDCLEESGIIDNLPCGLKFVD